MARLVSRRRRAIVCRQAVEMMTDYLEGAMPDRQRVRFEGHLAGCAACRAYLDQMRLMIRAMGHIDPASLPGPVLEEIVDLYRRQRAG